MPVKSPLTGQETFESSRSKTRPPCFLDSVGTWHLMDHVLGALLAPDKPYVAGEQSYSLNEVQAGWLVVRSKLWRHKHNNPDELFCVVSQPIYESLAPREKEAFADFTLVSLEACIAEGREATPDDRCRETLYNVDLLWRKTRKPVNVPYQVGMGDGKGMDIRYKPDAQEDGMAYGCDEVDAVIIYQSLVHRNWLQPTLVDGSLGWMTAPAGYEELDRLRRRGVNLNQAFFVRKWDPAMDAFFRDIRIAVQEKTGVQIEAVWDRPHNDNIDERILRLIRESAVLVVEVAPDRFNVGLEAGYALALRKPIVAIRREPSDPKDKPLPFDIATLHCYDYKIEEKLLLIEKLSEKLMVAISDAKIAVR